MGVTLDDMLYEKSRASYMPPEYIDQEGPVTGVLTERQWRNNVPEAHVKMLR